MPILTSARNTVHDKIDASSAYDLKITNNKPWFTPTIVLVACDKLSNKIGWQKFEKDGKFKQVREMRAVALFLLGVIQFSQKEHWLQAMLNEQTPDVRTFCFDRNSEGVVEQVIQEVEVVTYNSYAEKELVEFVESKKITNRSYPSYYVILCELRRNFRLPSPKKLHEKFTNINPQQNIAFIGKISQHSQIYRALKVYPKIDLIEDFDAVELARELDILIKNEGRHHTMVLHYKAKTKELNLKDSTEIHHPFADFLEPEYCVK